MTIKEIKSRIKSVKSIKKITKAMQMVSASKLRYITERLEVSNKYISLVNSFYTIKKETTNIDSDNLNKLLVLISADRGLCGSHSTSIIKKYLSLSENDKKNSHLIIVGSKAYDNLKKTHSKSIALNFLGLFKKNFSFFELINVGNKINKLVLSGNYNNIDFIFNKYISSVSNEIDTLSVNLNLELELELDTINTKSGFKNFLNFYLISILFSSLCHSKACEESIRMTSMDNATTSADELIEDLTRLYNMSRQASITTELIEIISGAESLKQGKN